MDVHRLVHARLEALECILMQRLGRHRLNKDTLADLYDAECMLQSMLKKEYAFCAP